MALDLAIKNGKVVSPTGIERVGIGIYGGKIACIASDASLPEADKVIDAKGNYVLPGIIDAHTHIGGVHPYETEVRQETEAAAWGGVTTVGNFVGIAGTSQKGSYAEKFDQWKNGWEKNALIDAFFHGCIISETNLQEIGLNAQRYGITSYKFFMAYKGPEGEQIGAEAADDGLLWTGFKEIARLGPPALAMVHAENIDIVYRIKPILEAQNRQDLAAWADSRPGFCEALDVERAASIARITGAPLYIVHTSDWRSVDAIAKARADGTNIVGETCPHYLVLTKFAPLGPLGKVNPPLRDEQSKEALWRGLKDGTIQCMGTDHAALMKEMKQDMWKGWPGLSGGVEYFLPLMLSEGVNKGRITLEKLVEVCCYNNAKVFGIYPRKGTISVGSDADLVIVDLEKKGTLSVEKGHYLGDFCPYEGMEVKGWPVTTIVRGNVLVENGKLVGKPGIGRYLPRSVERYF